MNVTARAPNFWSGSAVVKGPAVSIGNFVKVIYPVLVPCNKIVADRSVSCAAAQFRASNESLGGERCCAAIRQLALHRNRT